MSHVVTVITQMKDPIALAAACRRLGLNEPVADGSVKLTVSVASFNSGGETR